MLKPLLNGFTETSMQTNKLQLDHDGLEARVKALEIVFNNGQGKNYIYDNLISLVAEEVSQSSEANYPKLFHSFVAILFLTVMSAIYLL